MHICHFICYFSYVLKCGEWPYLFATIVANEKILLDIAALDRMNFGQICPTAPPKPKFWLRLWFQRTKVTQHWLTYNSGKIITMSDNLFSIELNSFVNTTVANILRVSQRMTSNACFLKTSVCQFWNQLHFNVVFFHFDWIIEGWKQRSFNVISLKFKQHVKLVEWLGTKMSD